MQQFSRLTAVLDDTTNTHKLVSLNLLQDLLAVFLW